MGKVALICATAAGALAVGAVAGAVTGPSIDVRLQDNRAGTASTPRGVGRLTVTIRTPLAPGEAPRAARRVIIHFDENLVFRPAAFGTCSAILVRRDASKCPASSRIGFGSAAGTLFAGASPTAKVAPTVTAYNGPPSSRGTPRIFLLVVERGFGVTDVMPGTLQRDTGRYGRKLDVRIPPKLRNGGLRGVTISLTKFVTSVGGTRRGTPFVALRGCSGGTLHYRGDFTFTDGATRSATSTAPCRR